MYNLLKNINNNFKKLFNNCNINELNYIPLTFYTSNDIEALIVLYQIIEIYSSNCLLHKQILNKIISIKCNEHLENINFEMSFRNYIEYNLNLFLTENDDMIII